MMKAWILLSIALLLALIGCRQATDEAAAPTPAPTFGARAILAEAVSPVTLLRNPSAFEDSFVRVAGSYKPLPIIVCGGDTHLSPATWALTSGDGQINSAGFDRALRDLASEGLPLVVDGRWRRWEGPVGCGRRAPIEQIWYLDVLRIVSPNPLTLADASSEQDEVAQALPTGSPDGAGDQSLNTPGPGSGSTTPVPTPTPTSSLTPSLDLTGTPTPSETDVAATSAIATSDRATALAATAAAGSPSTVSPTPEATGTLTSTQTSTGSATPTPSVTSTTNPNATATTTVIPGEGIRIFYEGLSERPINAGDRQQWDFEGDAQDVVTVSAAPGPNLDIALQLVDQTGTTLGTADRGGAGFVETISQVTLPADGNYAVAVETRGGTSGRYALTLVNSFSTPFYIFQGNLAKGGFGSGSLREGTDHLWNYSGTAGERLTIRLLGTTENDLVLYVNGPGAESNDYESEELYFEDDDELDEEGAADLEELINIELDVTGIYTIGVGDNEFGVAEYTLGLE